MSGYILSILGIVLIGVIIDVIVPSGSINKYIKSVFSIFVVAVIISPVVTFISNKNGIKIDYSNYEMDNKLIEYIFEKRTENEEIKIENYLRDEGFDKVDIKLNFSINNNELEYISCQINLSKLVISADKQHINKYEFIKEIVKDFTNLTDEEIVINE
jgi:stage III sporulation protein AF